MLYHRDTEAQRKIKPTSKVKDAATLSNVAAVLNVSLLIHLFVSAVHLSFLFSLLGDLPA
jgi:hypothetical protein